MILALAIASLMLSFATLLGNIYIVCVFGKPCKYENKKVLFAYIFTVMLFLGLVASSVVCICLLYGVI